VKNSDGRNEEKAKTPEKATSRDVVLVQGVTEDLKGLRVIRARDQGIEAGEVRPLKEGQPITSDVVKLHPRKEAPFLCDVETTYSVAQTASRAEGTASSTKGFGAPGGRPTKAGPAQVASQTYRENWDAIWAKRPLDKGSSELN
jgi:hypothetical protein